MKEVPGVAMVETGGLQWTRSSKAPTRTGSQLIFLQSLCVSLRVLVVQGWLGGFRGIPWAHTPSARWGQRSSGSGCQARSHSPSRAHVAH